MGTGGRTRAVAVDRTDERVLLAGAVSGGMWRSQDTGRSWERVTDPDQLQNVTGIAQDPRPGAGNVWYFCTGEGTGSTSPVRGEGVFRSTDGGRSWTGLSRGEPEVDSVLAYTFRVVVDPSNQDQDELYVAGFGGILRSTDGGESWKVVLGGAANGARATDVAITADGVVYATLGSDGANVRGIWKSEDGVNWTEITPPGFPRQYYRIMLDIPASAQDVVYFFLTGAENQPRTWGHAMWYYRDRGSLGGIWEDRTAGVPDNFDTYGGYCMALKVKPDNENVVFFGGVHFCRSTNGCRDLSSTTAFNSAVTSGLHPDFHAMEFFPSTPAKMVTGHDGGISVTQNCLKSAIDWEFRNQGYVTTQFYTVAVDRAVQGSDAIVGGTQDNGTWLYTGGAATGKWVQAYGGDGGYCAIADSGRTYYVSSQNGNIFRGVPNGNGGLTGLRRATPPDANAAFFSFIHPFLLDPADERIIYLPERRSIWRGTDPAENPDGWLRLDETGVPASEYGIIAFGASRANPPHRLYYGAINGGLYRMDNADTGTPAGADISASLPKGSPVGAIAVDPYDADNVLAAFSGYGVRSLFHTTDGGETWRDVGGNLEQNPDGSGDGPAVVSLATLPAGNRRVYFAGTTAGLFTATRLDGANTRWVREGASTIGNAWVTMIDLRESDGFVVAATHGRGVFGAHVLTSLAPATASVTPAEIDFGDVRVGTTVRDTVVLRHHAGSSRDVRWNVEPVRPPFLPLAGFGETLLEPGKEGRVIIAFSPESVGAWADSLVADHNATDPEGAFVIYLSGRGTLLSGTEETNAMKEAPPLRGYPNPFSKSVELRFPVKKRGTVLLKVLAADGAEVAVLIDGDMEAGAHTALWSPGSVANGVYYIRLETGGETSVIPVVLQR